MAKQLTVKQVLTRARARLSDPKMFLRHRFYHPKTGATCAIGAVREITGFGPLMRDNLDYYFSPQAGPLRALTNRAVDALDATLSEEYGYTGGVVTFNDRRAGSKKADAHANVLELFDRTIARMSRRRKRGV